MLTLSDSELRFLVSCINPAGNRIVSDDLSRLDWGLLTELAVRHRLIPLVYVRLQSSPDLDIPADMLTWFEQNNIANSVRNVFLSAELVKVLDILREAQIDVMPFKGPVLALEAYGNISMRQFDDIDLLVRKEDIPHAVGIMREKGYEPLLDMPENTRTAHVNAGWGVSLKSPEKDYHLELISNVVPDLFSFQLPDECIWQQTADLMMEAGKVQTLSPECNLVMLCVHGAKHQWERLAWIADTAYLLISKPGINWRIVLDMTQQSGSRRMLLLGLHLANTLIGIPLPIDVEKMIAQDSHVSSLASRVLRKYTLPGEAKHSDKEEVMFHLEARERPSDRLRYIFSLLFVPGYSDWQAIQLPPLLYPLYNIIRPFRLILKLLDLTDR